MQSSNVGLNAEKCQYRAKSSGCCRMLLLQTKHMLDAMDAMDAMDTMDTQPLTVFLLSNQHLMACRLAWETEG